MQSFPARHLNTRQLCHAESLRFSFVFFRRGDRDADSSLTDPGIRLAHCYGKFLLNVSRRRLIQKIQDLSKLLVGQISELAIGLRRRDECHPMNDRGRFGQMT